MTQTLEKPQAAGKRAGGIEFKVADLSLAQRLVCLPPPRQASRDHRRRLRAAMCARRQPVQRCTCVCPR